MKLKFNILFWSAEPLLNTLCPIKHIGQEINGGVNIRKAGTVHWIHFDWLS